MKAYPEYKSSNIDWLGEIPSHWEVVRFKYYFETSTGITFTKADLTENGHEVVSYGQIHSSDNVGTYISPKLIRYIPDPLVNGKDNCLVNVGNFIFADTSEDLDGCGNCVYVDRPIYAGYHTIQAKLTRDNFGKYFSYLFLTNSWRSQIREKVYGIKVFSITQAILNSTNLLLPPFEEQESIAGYLDEVTTKIDALMVEKRAQVEDLRKYRISLITETATRGINPDAPLRPSGVDWLGDIPEHWKDTKLKYLVTKVGSGITPRGGAEVYSDSGILFLRSQNIYDDGLHLDDPKYISTEIDEDMSNSRVFKNDLLLNITGASIGRCCLYNLEESANVNQHVCIVRVMEKISPLYLKLVINSRIGQTQIALYQTGGNREGLNYEQLRNFYIPLPPLSEQLQIADFLDEKTAKIDTLIEELEAQLRDLATYRQAVITEAVTGKVDVRDWTPKN